MSGTQDERLETLEIKVAYQEQTIAQLNDVIVEQQRRLDELEARYKALLGQLEALAPPGGTPPDVPEPPPHY